MNTYYKTASGSIYEVDQDGLRIRRLEGKREPTPRQGEDGEWKVYQRLDFNIYGGLNIVWRTDETPEGTIERTTQTSMVVIQSQTLSDLVVLN